MAFETVYEEFSYSVDGLNPVVENVDAEEFNNGAFYVELSINGRTYFEDTIEESGEYTTESPMSFTFSVNVVEQSEVVRVEFSFPESLAETDYVLGVSYPQHIFPTYAYAFSKNKSKTKVYKKDQVYTKEESDNKYFKKGNIIVSSAEAPATGTPNTIYIQIIN